MSFLRFLSHELALHIVTDLLKLNPDEVSVTLNLIFTELVEHNIHLDIIKLLSIDQSRMASNPNNNKLLVSIAQTGNLEIFKLLLENPGINLNVNNGYSNLLFVHAFDQGHFEIVKLLILDKRIDPSSYDNQMIRYASQLGNVQIVELLLADLRVDIGFGNNCAIKLAFRYNHLDVVKLLISKIDLSTITDKEIIDIAKKIEI